MTMAKHLQRADRVIVKLDAEVLSVEPLPNGMVKVRIAAIGSTSLDFADSSGVIEIVCKSYRPFASKFRPWRGDDNGGDDGDDDGGPDAPAPSNLEPAS